MTNRMAPFFHIVLLRYTKFKQISPKMDGRMYRSLHQQCIYPDEIQRGADQQGHIVNNLPHQCLLALWCAPSIVWNISEKIPIVVNKGAKLFVPSLKFSYCFLSVLFVLRKQASLPFWRKEAIYLGKEPWHSIDTKSAFL